MKKAIALTLLFSLAYVGIVAGMTWGFYSLLTGPGSVAIDVSERDHHWNRRTRVSVPGGLVNLGLGVLSLATCHDDWDRVDSDLEDWLPAVRAAVDELDRYPDVPLLVIAEGDEVVRIEKRAGAFVVDIESENTDVRIEVPPGTVDRLIDILEDL